MAAMPASGGGWGALGRGSCGRGRGGADGKAEALVKVLESAVQRGSCPR